MKLAVVLGTRPEIIKFSPVLRECVRLGLDFFVLHSGQHYSYNMDRVFFEQLKRLGRLGGRGNIVAGILKLSAEKRGHLRFVVDYKYSRHA